MDFRVGDKIIFGRKEGEKTLGVITKINPKTYGVRTLESRGTKGSGAEWRVGKGAVRRATEREIEREEKAPQKPVHHGESKKLEALMREIRLGEFYRFKVGNESTLLEKSTVDKFPLLKEKLEGSKANCFTIDAYSIGEVREVLDHMRDPTKTLSAPAQALLDELTKEITNNGHWYNYYKQAVGFTIVGVEINDGFKTLIAKKGNQKLYMTIQRDPEGNGPGILYGLGGATGTKTPIGMNIIGLKTENLSETPNDYYSRFEDGWLTYYVLKDGKRYELELSGDPEGNLPGYIRFEYE